MLFNLVKGWLFSPLRMFLKLAFWGVMLAFVLLVVFLLTFNLNSFRKDIETAASAFLKNELKINGDIKLGLEDFRPSIILNDVKIGEDGRTTVVLADRLEIILPFQKPDADNPFSIFANLENLRIDGRTLGNYDIPVKFTKNGFTISKAKGGHDGGTLETNLFFDGHRFHLSADIDKAKYEELGQGISDGNFRADIVLDAKGPAFTESLSGYITILGGEGKIEGDALGLWAGDLMMRFLKTSKKETEIQCSVISFGINRGMATSKALIIDTPDITIFGSGTINLPDQYVDLIFTPKPKNASLFTLATPMRVRGKFGALKTTPDPAAVATKLGGFLLGMINPAAAFLPMMTLGSGERNPCLKYLEKK